MEPMNWNKEWIDFFFALFATGLGVLGAFELDRWRDSRKDKDRKIKLIQSLLEEINGLDKYIREHTNLAMYQNLTLQTEVIEETFKDQFDLLSQKTNNILKRVRLELIIKDEELAEWTELNKLAIGTGRYPNNQSIMSAGNIQGNWTTFVVNMPNELLLLKKALLDELS